MDLGVEKACEWTLVNGRPTFTLVRDGGLQNILYAFVTGEEVKYIGKTCQSLHKSPGPSQRTNIRNQQQIEQALEVGLSMDILAFAPNEPLTFRGYQVNLAAGLEDTRVAGFSPEWNIMGR